MKLQNGEMTMTGAGHLQVIRGASTVNHRDIETHLQHSSPPKGDGEAERTPKAAGFRVNKGQPFDASIRFSL